MASNRPRSKTNIDDKEIEKWLSDYFGKSVKLKSCKANKIGAGQGFTASVYRLLFEYDHASGENSLPKSAVLKVPSRAAIEETIRKLRPNTDSDIEDEIESHLAAYANECTAYEVLGKHSPLPLPIIYATRPVKEGQAGAILMEDLGERASIIGGIFCTLPLENLLEVADVLADYHAWCLTTHVNWKQYFDPADSDHRKQAYHEKEFATMKKCFQRVKENYPNVFDQMDMEKAKRIFALGYMSGMLKKHSAMVPNVLVHGDMYANNLMFEKKTDECGKAKIGSKLIAIIDWPMAHRGSGMKDFATLMAFSVDKSIRRQHTVNILRRYYDRLVAKAGIDKVKAPFEDLLEVYDEQFVIAGMGFVFMLDWWQKLFAGEGDKGKENREILFKRSLDVYEDLLPQLEKCDV